MGILRNHSHSTTVQYSTVQYYIVQYYTQYTMTRTWVFILAVSLVLLACSSAEEEQEGAVKASMETGTDLLERETREASAGNRERRQKRKNGKHVRRRKTRRRKGGKVEKKQKKEKTKKRRNTKKGLKKKEKRPIKKTTKSKRRKGVKKAGKVSEEATEGNKRIHNKSGRKEEKFTHCDYLDLTEIGLRNDESFCESGGKFLFKAMKSHRRQFLMTNTSNIAVFLKHKHKITNCTQLNDITERVKCKQVNGVEKLSIKSAIGGCLKSYSPQGGNPSGVKPAVPPSNALVLGSATTVYCPCPETRSFICMTKVVSNGNMHTITCNNMASVTVSCGSDLVGAKNVLGLSVDWYKHKLCSTKEYKSILIDYTWRCKDRQVPVPDSSWCKGDPAPAPTTMGPIMTTSNPMGRHRGRRALAMGGHNIL